MNIAALTLLLLTITTPAETEEPKEDPKEEPKPPSIALFAETKGAGKGLLVEIVAPALLAGEKTVFSYRITNLLEEEVFVELPSDLSVSYSYEGPEGPGGSAGGGGIFTVFPDNVHLLKRLHASSYKTGERFTCGCAAVTSTATVNLPESASVKGKAEIQLVLKGFYRSSGKPFFAIITLPLPLRDK